MAKRLTQEERNNRAIIQRHLNEFGEKTIAQVKKVVRVNTSRLKDTLNYTVKPYNVLTFSQQYYGKFNTAKGKPTRSVNKNDYNPLLRKIEEEKNNLQNVILKDLKESILYKYKDDKSNRNK